MRMIFGAHLPCPSWRTSPPVFQAETFHRIRLHSRAKILTLGILSIKEPFYPMRNPATNRAAGPPQMEERFRAAFESSAIGMGLLALDGRILAVNATVCAMSGYSERS